MGMQTRRLVFPAVAVAAVGAVITVGVVAFGAGDSSASCDSHALEQAMHGGISDAERHGHHDIVIEIPAGCTDADLELTMPRISRDWHVMPGGVLMREGQHTDP